jgi:hypothetical protein
MNWHLQVHNSQHCTPDHWGTYYLMTLYNMGAFSTAVLAEMNPDAPTSSEELEAWAKVAAGKKPVPPALKPGPVTRAELAQFVDDLMRKQ